MAMKCLAPCLEHYQYLWQVVFPEDGHFIFDPLPLNRMHLCHLLGQQSMMKVILCGLRD